jgi:SET domain-containing protein
MLLVKTKLGLSNINGIGLYADAYIPAGTLIWRFESKLDLKLCQSEYQVLKEQYDFETLDKYIYKSRVSGCYILCTDDARFINHSSKPNTLDTQEGDEGLTIAARAIVPGEEITSNYESFDADFHTYSDSLR